MQSLCIFRESESLSLRAHGILAHAHIWILLATENIDVLVVNFVRL